MRAGGSERDELLALALRLLEEPVWDDDGDTLLAVSPVLTPRNIPEHLQDVLPVPPESAVVGTAEYPEGDGRGSIVLFDSRLDADSVVRSCGDSLRARGWLEILDLDVREELREDEARQSAYVKRGDERQVTVQAWPKASEDTHVRVQIAREPERDPELVAFDHYLWRIVNGLLPPANSSYTSDTEGRVWDPRTMASGLYATGSLIDIHEGFAKQLEELGWNRTRETRGRDEHRSRWIVRDDQGAEWIVYLIVAAGPGEPKPVFVKFERGPGVDQAFG